MDRSFKWIDVNSSIDIFIKDRGLRCDSLIVKEMRCDNMKLKILVIDDEYNIRKLISDFLVAEDYDIILAEDGEEGVEIFNSVDDIRLVIVDVMMPKKDGWMVCREIRENSDVPVIILTAREHETDEIFGLELGADEYITKPFKPKVLVARVKALLRRTETREEQQTIVEGALEVDTVAHKVFHNSNELDLSPTEFNLLVYFVLNKGIALSRNKILDAVWGIDYFGGLRTVDTHIKRVRLKLGDDGKYIKTVRGMGYRFEV